MTYEAPANKVSGYTPLIMQGSNVKLSSAIKAGSQPEILHPKASTIQVQPQFEILHPTASTFQPKASQYRQARELLLQPGFEA